ncbi:methyl-accepting chemotaxis protein [Reichenbachiella versicolor]|uniref:methyl-accepting chemotaxis protein n=1 Tax=Reichenbachiella versicolor TaxID=1821036 RepID=UPI000D6DD671|nr:methyl-accepting chemotaxis protein [Reichenbachiella versicolor]
MNIEITEELDGIRKKNEIVITYLMVCFFIFGVGISFHYDTFLLGFGLGGINLVFFMTARFVFPGQLISRIAASISMAVYMLQYVAQMHGMYEMHFWFFIMPVVLIFYMDWRVFVPLVLIVTIHHTYFFVAFLQGSDTFQQYFLNLSSLNWSIYLYHMGMAIVGQLAAIWAAYKLKNETVNNLLSGKQVKNQLIELKRLTLEAKKVSNELTFVNNEGEQDTDEDQSIEDILSSMGNDFSNGINTLINETNTVVDEAGRNGKLSARMSVDGKTGAWVDMAYSINDLLDSVSKPIVELNTIANEMSNGNLTKRFDVNLAKGDVNELIMNFNKSMDQLVGLLKVVTDNVSELKSESEEMSSSGLEMTNATTEIVSAMTEISTGAQRQVNSIEGVSETLESVLRAAKSMEEKASTVLGSVSDGLSNSEKGQVIVGNVVSDMKSISSYAAETNNSIQVLNERSNEISRVLGVITEISSQTNLLALNAAIEAAQAGDAGRGFAVVAEEIRKLAEDSRNSAKEIEKLVEDVKLDTANATKVMETMSESVQSGVKSSQESATVFESIYKSSTSSYELTEQIMNQTKSQTESVSTVVNNVESVVVIAEETAAGSEEVSASATELSSGMKTYTDKSSRFNQMATDITSKMKQFRLG